MPGLRAVIDCKAAAVDRAEPYLVIPSALLFKVAAVLMKDRDKVPVKAGQGGQLACASTRSGASDRTSTLKLVISG